MLKQTFRHIPGIGATTESRFWANGMPSWDTAESTRLNFRSRRLRKFNHFLSKSHHSLAAGDARFFADSLPSGLHWRLFPEFRNRIAYLDIETTGLFAGPDHITTIALYDGQAVRHYVFGRNLDDFKRDISRFALIATYNGKCFDVPFIEHCLHCHIPQAHIDLRYLLQSLGYTGGLKGCERTLGYTRPGLEDVDGFFAVLLWNEFERSGDEAVLETLLAYNVEDVLTLERLLVFAYNQKLRETPFAGTHTLADPSAAVNPFRPHHDVTERIRRRFELVPFSLQD